MSTMTYEDKLTYYKKWLKDRGYNPEDVLNERKNRYNKYIQLNNTPKEESFDIVPIDKDNDDKDVKIDKYDENDLFINNKERKYRKAVNFVRETGRCNQWILKQKLHIGDKFANNILKRLFKEGVILNEIINKSYVVVGYNNEED